MNARYLAILSLIILGVMSRFLPHPPNFNAMNSIALFGASTIGSLPLSLLTLFITLFLSDMMIGFYSTMVFVYSSFALIACMGRYYKSEKGLRDLAKYSLASSILFFVITNFGVFLNSSLYPKTLEGLVLCYTAAIPFFFNQVVGDLFFGSLLFGAFHLAKKHVLKLA